MEDFRLNGGRPGDERGFVHKKLLGAIGGLGIPVVSGVASTVRGFLGGSRTLPRSLTARPTAFSEAEKQFGRQSKFPLGVTSGGGPCPTFLPGVSRDPVSGKCIFGTREGRDLPSDRPIGEAVMGQYGAALVPGSMPVDRAVCLRGMQLGNDGLCYNKSQISNKQRMWPAGRKPLLTGGDMAAISKAARAGKRMDLATKRLQKMGMMKKPVRRAGPTRHAALLEAHVGSKH